MADGTDSVPFERDRDLNIYQRLHAVMGEVGFLEKDKEVKIGRDGGYGYISHDAVAAAVRGPFMKYGVMLAPSVTKHENNTNRTEITVSISFINIDAPDDSIVVHSIGYGVDGSDKGPGKAYSYAVKYALLKVLMLNSSDDIEDDDVKHEPDNQNAAAMKAQAETTKKAMEAAATNLRGAIKGCDSVEDLKALKRKNGSTVAGMPEAVRDFFETKYKEREGELSE